MAPTIKTYTTPLINIATIKGTYTYPTIRKIVTISTGRFNNGRKVFIGWGNGMNYFSISFKLGRWLNAHAEA